MDSTVIDYENLVQAAYEAFLKVGDNAIDVGAHLGRHCIPIAQRVFPTGRVFAFEPLPICREALARKMAQHHVELSRVITIYPCALSDFEGQAEFVVAKDALGYSGLKERKYDGPTKLERIQVQVKRIDSLFLNLPQLRYVKIDAEGGEYHILKGAVACLRKHRPVVGFEFGARGIDEYEITPRDMAAFLAENNYKIYDITGKHLPDENDFIQSANAQHVWDYVGVPVENAALEESIVKELRAAYQSVSGGALWSSVYRSQVILTERGELQILAPGLTGSVTIRVRNVGQDTWSISSSTEEGKGCTRIGIIWFLSGKMEQRVSEQRAELPRDVFPGDEVEVKVPLDPLGYDGKRLPPGDYEVWIGLVQEHVTWFYQKGDEVLKLHVVIRNS